MTTFKWTEAEMILIRLINKASVSGNPEDLFALKSVKPSDLLRSLRKEFTKMMKIVHPDKHSNSDEANEALRKLVGVRDIAEYKIKSGEWGKIKPVTIFFKNTKGKTSEIREIFPLGKGDICDLYTGKMGDKKVVFKQAQFIPDNDLLGIEEETINHFWSDNDKFTRYLTPIIDSVVIDGRRANILEFEEETYSLSEVIAAHPDGIDQRHASWIWRRILEIMAWVHTKKDMIHGALVPSNILIRPKDHGVKILDWCYSTKITNPVDVIIPSLFPKFYPPETKDKIPTGARFDIFMIGKTVESLLLGKRHKNLNHINPLFTGILSASTLSNPNRRYQCVPDLYKDLDDNLTKLFGPKKFIEFKMP